MLNKPFWVIFLSLTTRRNTILTGCRDILNITTPSTQSAALQRQRVVFSAYKAVLQYTTLAVGDFIKILSTDLPLRHYEPGK